MTKKTEINISFFINAKAVMMSVPPLSEIENVFLSRLFLLIQHLKALTNFQLILI